MRDASLDTQDTILAYKLAEMQEMLDSLKATLQEDGTIAAVDERRKGTEQAQEMLHKLKAVLQEDCTIKAVLGSRHEPSCCC